MGFARIGSTATCNGSGCKARLTYGATAYVVEREGDDLPVGTVLCVRCATEGAPSDVALLRKLDSEGLSGREEARAEYVLSLEPPRLKRSRSWSVLRERLEQRRRERFGETTSEMKRQAAANAERKPRKASAKKD